MRPFLEVKVEGTPRRLDGKYHPVATYLRDYKSVNGLMVPFVLETAVEGVTLALPGISSKCARLKTASG